MSSYGNFPAQVRNGGPNRFIAKLDPQVKMRQRRSTVMMASTLHDLGKAMDWIDPIGTNLYPGDRLFAAAVTADKRPIDVPAKVMPKQLPPSDSTDDLRANLATIRKALDKTARVLRDPDSVKDERKLPKAGNEPLDFETEQYKS